MKLLLSHRWVTITLLSSFFTFTIFALNACSGLPSSSEQRAELRLQEGRRYLQDGMLDSALAAFRPAQVRGCQQAR
jgi:hypothetical protein